MNHPRRAVPKVSIIIPVYNGSNYLKEAINSALDQTYGSTEVIVINDGSKDDGATEEIAQSYGDKVRYFNKENHGVAAALNFGIEKMTGDYFSWLSHDDLYEKTKVAEQVKYLEKINREDVILACNVKVLFASGIKKKDKIDTNTFSFIDIFLATSAQVGVNGCSLLIPKKAFEICGNFNTGLPFTQDYDMWFRMKDKYKFVLLDKYLVISRRHADQDSVKKQNSLYEAADQLHYGFLNTISYKRFEEYFHINRNNIQHTYKNFQIYKSRGYNKTASMILKIILKYYYQNDKKTFYDIFNSEVESSIAQKPVGARENSEKLTSADWRMIDLEYNTLINSGVDNFPIKKPAIDHIGTKPKTRVGRLTGQLRESIKRDGVYLTGEKTVRKIYRRITKKTSKRA